MSTKVYTVHTVRHDSSTIIRDLIREIEIATLVKLYKHAQGKKISLETLGEPFGIPKQTLHNHVQRDE